MDQLTNKWKDSWMKDGRTIGRCLNGWMSSWGDERWQMIGWMGGGEVKMGGTLSGWECR